MNSFVSPVEQVQWWSWAGIQSSGWRPVSGPAGVISWGSLGGCIVLFVSPSSALALKPLCARERETLIKTDLLASVLIRVWYCMLLPVGLWCLCNCEHSVIPLDYLHAFPSAQLSCNPWGPGSRGLNLVSSQYYYTSQGAQLRHNQNTTSRCTFIERVFKWKEKSETLRTVFGHLSQTHTHTHACIWNKLGKKLWRILHGTDLPQRCTQKTCCSNPNAFYLMIRSQLLHDHFAIAT